MHPIDQTPGVGSTYGGSAYTQMAYMAHLQAGTRREAALLTDDSHDSLLQIDSEPAERPQRLCRLDVLPALQEADQLLDR